MKEAGLVDVVRAAHDADRAMGCPGQDRGGGGGVVAGDVALGDAVGGVEDAVGVRDADAEELGEVALLWLWLWLGRRRGGDGGGGGDGSGLLAADLAGGLVVADAGEDGVAQATVAGPVGEADLDDDLGLHKSGARAVGGGDRKW